MLQQDQSIENNCIFIYEHFQIINITITRMRWRIIPLDKMISIFKNELTTLRNPKKKEVL